MKSRLCLTLLLGLTLSFPISACDPAINDPNQPVQEATSELPTAIADYALLPNEGLAMIEVGQKSIAIQSSPKAKLERVTAPSGRIQKIVASPDGKRLLVLIGPEVLTAPAKGTVYEQAQVFVLELENLQLKAVEGAKIVAYSSQPQWYPNSQQFVYIDLEERLRRYDFATKVDHLVSEQKRLSGPLLSSDGKNIVVTHVQSEFEGGPGLMSYRKPLKQILLFNSEEKMQTLTPSIDESHSAEFLYPDGTILASRFKGGKQTLVKISSENQVLKEYSRPNLYLLSGKPSPDEQNILLESSSNVSDALTVFDKSMLVLKSEKNDKNTTLISRPGSGVIPYLVYQCHWLNPTTALFLKEGKIYKYSLSSQKESLYR